MFLQSLNDYIQILVVDIDGQLHNLILQNITFIQIGRPSNLSDSLYYSQIYFLKVY